MTHERFLWKPGRVAGWTAAAGLLAAGLALAGCADERSEGAPAAANRPDAAERTHSDMTDSDRLETAVLAGGCFWCTEAVFEQLEGVEDVVSGYSGGKKETANYEAVCSGATNHAEAIRITYDPEKIAFEDLLEVFFTVAHDPTQLNRQGPDVGRQYRSAIFYRDERQKRAAEESIRKLREENAFGDREVVTMLEAFDAFYEAEDYHQDYAACNPRRPYIRYNAEPKVDKVRAKFADRVKADASR